MVNTKYVVTLILLGLLSCKQPKSQSLSKSIFLVGKWENCEDLSPQDDGRSTEIMRNVCPFITFDKNNTGYVKMGEVSFICFFHWSVENDKLILKDVKNIGSPFFGIGAYKLLYENSKVINEVVLFDTVHKVKYILER